MTITVNYLLKKKKKLKSKSTKFFLLTLLLSFFYAQTAEAQCPPGINWTSVNYTQNNGWYSIAYGNGIFVAVAQSTTTKSGVMTSPDGVTWTSRTAAANNDWTS